MKQRSMKRVGLFLLIPAGCFLFLLLLSCGKNEAQLPPSTPSAEHVRISGSAAVIPLLKTLAQEFAKENNGIEIVFLPPGHSAAGIAGINENAYDIGAVSRESLDNEKDSSLRYLHLAVDGMVFAVNPKVNISDLKTDEIRHIYAGIITNWNQVGGPDAPITVIDRPEHTSAKMAFRVTFLGKDFQVAKDAVVVERPWQVTDSIQMLPYSIGYTSLAEILRDNPTVKVISVNGILPSYSHLKDGQYKFFRPFGLVLGSSPAASTMRFVNFVYSETGAKIMENSGYLPQRYEIIVGIVPEQNIMVQNQRYTPLIDYLSQKLGERFSIKLKLYPTYIDVCRDLATGEINAAFLGSLAYGTVRKYVHVLARPDYEGISTYRGLLFVRADSGINDLSQMRGKRLILGGKTTMAGYVFPLYYFKKNGIPNYREYFSEVNFVGTHEDAISAVLQGRADVGAAKDLVYHMLDKENPALSQHLKILAQSQPVPSNAFVLRKDVSNPCFDCHRRLAHKGVAGDKFLPELQLEMVIKDYLLKISDDPKGRIALQSLGDADKFIETKDSDYSELYKMLEEIKLKPEDLLKDE